MLFFVQVRCGTTTLCAHLAGLGESSQSFAPPFCPWKHPELDAKETFYFAGHYLGLVEPRLYPMCFPPTQGTFLAKLVATRARLGAAAAGLCALLTGQSSSQDKVQSAKRDQQWTFDGYISSSSHLSTTHCNTIRMHKTYSKLCSMSIFGTKSLTLVRVL